MASIERIDGPLPRWRLIDGDAVVEIAPSRGALVTSFVVDGTPLLFMDDATLLDPSKNVRGGVPILFPFAGKPPAGSTLPQHGFARTRAWEPVSAIADEATARFECKLESTPETLAAWPHHFEARFAISLFDERLMLEWGFTNKGSAPMPLHFGIHPYFVVGPKDRVKVTGTSVDFTAPEVDVHLTPFHSGGTQLERGDGKVVQLSWTEHFSTLVLWTLPGRDFVCVEPWTAPGQAPARHEVAPGSTERLAVACWLDR
jgi:galactose mutarotase-like enzyme